MIKVWFLMVLIAFPGVPVIQYKGFSAYTTKEECTAQQIPLENLIIDLELKRGKKTMFVKSHCLEMYAFPDQIEQYRKEKEKGIIFNSDFRNNTNHYQGS